MPHPSGAGATAEFTRVHLGGGRSGAAFLVVLALGILALHPIPSSSMGTDELRPAPRAGETEIPEGAWIGEAWNAETRVRITVDLVKAGEGWYGAIVFPDEGFLRFEPDSIQVGMGGVDLISRRPQVAIHARMDGIDAMTGAMVLRGVEMELRLFRGGSPEAVGRAAEVQERARQFREQVHLEAVAEGPALPLVSREGLDSLLASAEATFSTSVVVWCHGELVGEWHRGGNPRRVQAMSVTKVALNLMTGRLLTTGALPSIDTPVSRYFPEWSSEPYSRVTIRHLLAHTSGLPAGVPAMEIYQTTDVVRYTLDLSLEADPGTVLSYSNNGTNLLAGVLARVAGESVDTFLRDDLFAYLGIEDFTWIRDGKGNPHGMAGLSIHAGDLARIGQFALNHGEWQGEQLIDRSWFEKSFRAAGDGARGVGMLEGRADEIGLLWLLIRDAPVGSGDGPGPVVGIMHSGDLGQWLVVYPDEALVGVRMIQYSPAYNPGTDAFHEFQDLLRELVPREYGGDSG